MISSSADLINIGHEIAAYELDYQNFVSEYKFFIANNKSSEQ